MTHSNINFSWLGYCAAPNKIWGSFVDTNSAQVSRFGKFYGYRQIYVFWATVGKTISIKRHGSEYYISGLIEQKLKNKYEIITVDKLLELWPNVHDELENRMIFYKLVNSA